MYKKCFRALQNNFSTTVAFMTIKLELKLVYIFFSVQPT
uniref:Uncharacterized protein n=1 Tax=Arundo donax TaxID=35708 RepID=A0A0A9HQF8_ARUDO